MCVCVYIYIYIHSIIHMHSIIARLSPGVGGVPEAPDVFLYCCYRVGVL